MDENRYEEALKKISKKGNLALPSVFDLPEDVILKREIEDSFGIPRNVCPKGKNNATI